MMKFEKEWALDFKFHRSNYPPGVVLNDLISMKQKSISEKPTQASFFGVQICANNRRSADNKRVWG